MSERYEEESLAEANRLMEGGKREAARAILERLYKSLPPSRDLYENIIHNYLLGEYYEQAKETARCYEREFGTKPTPEISVEAIEKEQRKQQTIEDYPKTGEKAGFRRPTIGERGGLPRYLPWSPAVWKEVRVEPQSIVFVKHQRSYRLRWEEIRSVSLKKQRSFVSQYKSYVQKLIVLRTIRDETYKVDVSTTSPEFVNPRALEKAIKTHLPLKEGDIEEWDESRGMLGGMLAFLIVLLIATLGLWAASLLL